MRVAVIAGSVLLSLGLVSGCSGEQSPYCAAVEKGQKTLDSFGSKRTDAAFAQYAKTMSSIAKQAPSTSKKDWAALAKVTQGVIAAHQKVGFKLEDMDDEKKREGLSEGDISELNKAYAAFNDTQKQRKAVVADVKETCDIKLK